MAFFLVELVYWEHLKMMKILTGKMGTRLLLGSMVALALAGCGVPEEEEPSILEPSTSESALVQGSVIYIRNPNSNLCLFADESTRWATGDIQVSQVSCSGLVPAQGGNDQRFAWEIIDSDVGRTRLRNRYYGTCVTTSEFSNTSNSDVGELILKSCDVVCSCDYNRGYWANPPFSSGSSRNYMINGGQNVVTPYNSQLTSGNYVHDWPKEAGAYQNWKWTAW